MGQTFFAAKLLQQANPDARIESVALCTFADPVLVEIFEREAGCRVVVAPKPLLDLSTLP